MDKAYQSGITITQISSTKPLTFRIRQTEINVFIYECYILSCMESDAVESTATEASPKIMAAIESGTVDRFVLADVNSDGAYMTVPLAEAATLSNWR